MLSYGFKSLLLCDRRDLIWPGRPEGMNAIKEEIAALTNPQKQKGSLSDALRGADVFIGVSAPGTVTADMVHSMAPDAVVFACANPVPEIMPDDAKAGGARVIATGRSDFPNQINNVLAFPGVFRGAFDVRARDINDAMKVAAAEALAALISPDDLSPDLIIPSPFDPRVCGAVAAGVMRAAHESGVAGVQL
jgi:malate dehydrogenase (oxaloacetate-decarboxylating)